MSRRRLVQWHELLVGVIAFVLFVGLLTAGMAIGTRPNRQRLLGIGPEPATTNDFLVVVFCYTATNVAFLSVLAAYLGGLGRRMRIDGNRNPVLLESSLGIYGAAIVRGFLCYVMLIAGILIVATDSIIDAEQSQYVRLAGLTSVTAFLVGFQPDKISVLLKRIQQPTAEETEEANAGG